MMFRQPVMENSLSQAGIVMQQQQQYIQGESAGFFGYRGQPSMNTAPTSHQHQQSSPVNVYVNPMYSRQYQYPQQPTYPQQTTPPPPPPALTASVYPLPPPNYNSSRRSSQSTYLYPHQPDNGRRDSVISGNSQLGETQSSECSASSHWCGLCKREIYNLLEHVMGRRHLDMLDDDIISGRCEPDPTDPCGQRFVVPAHQRSTLENHTPTTSVHSPDQLPEAKAYRCNLCASTIIGLPNAKQHVDGKIHKKNWRKTVRWHMMNPLNSKTSSEYFELNLNGSGIEFIVPLPGGHDLPTQLAAANLEAAEHLPNPAASFSSGIADDDGCVVPLNTKHPFYCVFCKTQVANGMQNWVQHRSGKHHCEEKEKFLSGQEGLAPRRVATKSYLGGEPSSEQQEAANAVPTSESWALFPRSSAQIPKNMSLNSLVSEEDEEVPEEESDPWAETQRPDKKPVESSLSQRDQNEEMKKENFKSPSQSDRQQKSPQTQSVKSTSPTPESSSSPAGRPRSHSQQHNPYALLAVKGAQSSQEYLEGLERQREEQRTKSPQSLSLARPRVVSPESLNLMSPPSALDMVSPPLYSHHQRMESGGLYTPESMDLDGSVISPVLNAPPFQFSSQQSDSALGSLPQQHSFNATTSHSPQPSGKYFPSMLASRRHSAPTPMAPRRFSTQERQDWNKTPTTSSAQKVRLQHNPYRENSFSVPEEQQ